MNGKNVYLITFRSVTYAQRGERLLNRWGERCSLKRTPRWMEERGCGYCLQLRQRDVGASLILLQENGIPFSKIYRKEENGTVREVQRDLFG